MGVSFVVVEKVHGGEGFEDVTNCQMRPRSTTVVKKLGFPTHASESHVRVKRSERPCIVKIVHTGASGACQETSRARG